MNPDIASTDTPDWFHSQGDKVMVVFNPLTSELTLSSGSCHTIIKRTKDKDIWKVKTIIYHGRRDNFRKGATSGNTIFLNTQELNTAFDQLTFGPGGSDLEFTQRLGLTAGIPGCYARLGIYLNIPSMSMDTKNNPNASIKLNDKIRGAVAEFIARERAKW